MRPSVVVVTGPPASGKTTLARAIADDLGWPLLAKDTIKETLFDTLGTGDREWSIGLGVASMELLAKLIDEQLCAGRSVVAEANFRELHASAFARAHVVQVVCTGDPDELLERYRARTGRHPGHIDHERVADVEAAIRAGEHGQLPLDGDVFTYRVGDDVQALLAEVRRCVS